MPEVVLRHKDLPGQPYIVDVPVGGYVDRSYQASGWAIDADTSGDDARAELAVLAERSAKKQADAVEAFVPQFAPDPDAAPEVPVRPKSVPNIESAPVDTTKEH